MPILMHVVVVFVAVLFIHDSNRAWGFSAPSLTPKCITSIPSGTKNPLPEAAKLKLDKNYTVSDGREEGNGVTGFGHFAARARS